MLIITYDKNRVIATECLQVHCNSGKLQKVPARCYPLKHLPKIQVKEHETSENDLQRAVYLLNNTSKKYNCEISTAKTKIIAFQGRDSLRSKICNLAQITHFKCLGCDITYKYDRDIDNKIATFSRMCGTINRTLGKHCRKETATILLNNGDTKSFVWL